jgi:carboxymethylenebutenolidase
MKDRRMSETEIVTSEVTCHNGMPAFLARPDTPGPHPVYIFMHERYGLVTHTRDLAKRCARDGFYVLAPDFFFKHPDKKALNAGDSGYPMTDPESVEYLKAAMALLEKDKAADMKRVAVGGYCQTGRHPVVFAAEVPIAAVVIWYGGAADREFAVTERQPKPYEELIAKITCPVFGAFGEADHIIAIDEVRHLRDTLEKYKKSYDIHLYKGAPHGWLNDTMPGRYRKPQAEAGWAAQQKFLARVLAPDFDRETIFWEFEGAFSPTYDYSKNVRFE